MKNRVFILGSEWIYLKIYCNYRISDEILFKLKSYLNKSFKSNLIEGFFFIRYNDPDYHIRLRILLTNKNELQKVIFNLNEILEKLMKEKYIYKVQYDSYIREIERYENSLIEDIEKIFMIDSRYVIDLLSRIEDEDSKWYIGLCLIDDLLEAFSNQILEKKIEYIKILKESFLKEFGFNKYNSKQINSKYRESKDNVNNIILRREYVNNQNFTPLYKILKKRKKDLKSFINNILSLKLKQDIENNVELSIIHMTINRLIPAKNRLNEMLMYDFLYRCYESQKQKDKYYKN
ncbi:thiopeptide-type bacteriocin biosynthesis protein [Empedobacter sp.]|uniref:thiopeptide-type bacteriocin biosynthesis protein n=1 Tax=Empedobacter sp. TaxID=1927715 RepID=UPI0028A7EA77|nr:thiopeptide-type bacteriocin biosynthesis protein [Empedobacter sp.]